MDDQGCRGRARLSLRGFARYLSDGTLDAGFHADGRRTGFAHSKISVTAGFDVSTDGRIVLLVGVHLVRLLADGSLDPAFGDGTGS